MKVINNKQCSFCNETYNVNQYGDYNEIVKLKKDIPLRMLKDKICFSCAFWFERIDLIKADPLAYVIVGHQCNHDGGWVDKRITRGFLGHGGYDYTINFFDGRVLVTNNLWSQGKIPEIFWERIPNNAEFEPWEKTRPFGPKIMIDGKLKPLQSDFFFHKQLQS